MPIDSRCKICCDPAAKTAVDELAAKGGTVRSIAGQVKRSRSSVHRHLCHLGQKRLGGSRKSSGRGDVFDAGQLPNGRCSLCGFSLVETDPRTLLRRAERQLWIAETVAAQAQRDDDARLALQAVDRARSSLETMMRATGQIGGDGVVVNLNGDAMDIKRAFGVVVSAVPESRRDEFARIVMRFVGGETYEALPAPAESGAAEIAA